MLIKYVSTYYLNQQIKKSKISFSFYDIIHIKEKYNLLELLDILLILISAGNNNCSGEEADKILDNYIQEDKSHNIGTAIDEVLNAYNKKYGFIDGKIKIADLFKLEQYKEDESAEADKSAETESIQ